MSPTTFLRDVACADDSQDKDDENRMQGKTHDALLLLLPKVRKGLAWHSDPDDR